MYLGVDLLSKIIKIQLLANLSPSLKLNFVSIIPESLPPSNCSLPRKFGLANFVHIGFSTKYCAVLNNEGSKQSTLFRRIQVCGKTKSYRIVPPNKFSRECHIQRNKMAWFLWNHINVLQQVCLNQLQNYAIFFLGIKSKVEKSLWFKESCFRFPILNRDSFSRFKWIAVSNRVSFSQLRWIAVLNRAQLFADRHNWKGGLNQSQN